MNSYQDYCNANYGPEDVPGPDEGSVDWKALAESRLKEVNSLRALMLRIVDSRDNKNWRKPEIIQAVEYELRKPL